MQIKSFIEPIEGGFRVTIRSKKKRNPKSRRELIVQDGFASQGAAASWAERWIANYRREQKAKRSAARRESKIPRAMAKLNRLRSDGFGEEAAVWVSSLEMETKTQVLAALTLPERRTFDLWQKEKTERYAAKQAREAKLTRESEARAAVERAAHREKKKGLARLASGDRVLQGARSEHSLTELRGLGFTPAEIRAVSEWRRGALSLTQAAEHLGVPRGRLDRWEREGVVAASFHRRSHITGKGQVLKRMWRPEDLDALAQRLDGLAWRSAMQKKVTGD